MKETSLAGRTVLGSVLSGDSFLFFLGTVCTYAVLVSRKMLRQAFSGYERNAHRAAAASWSRAMRATAKNSCTTCEELLHGIGYVSVRM